MGLSKKYEFIQASDDDDDDDGSGKTGETWI